MIELHGVTISNYYNTVKLALVEKGEAFTEHAVFPSQDPGVVQHSPMGKVPWIVVDGVPLSETNVIFDYLEDTHPEPALYPADALARAKAKEIIRIVELYLDAVCRRHIQTVYFGAPLDQRHFDEVRPLLENGLKALKHVAKFDPYIAGPEFTFADIAAYFQLGFTNLGTKKIYDWDFIAGDADLKAYIERLNARPAVAEVAATMHQAMDKLFAKA